jgi:hypothetical protein
VLFADWPRSLAASLDEVRQIIARVRNPRSGRAEAMAVQLYNDVCACFIGEILRDGLHGWLTEFLARVNELGGCISRDFLVPLAPEPAVGQTQTQTQEGAQGETQGHAQTQTQSQTQTRTHTVAHSA